MEAIAKAKYIKIAPRKVRVVIDLIRNKPVGVAQGILQNIPKVASKVILKLLNSAVANAENNHGMQGADLSVHRVFVDQGATAKRIQPVSKGRGHRIHKRTSHITLIVKDLD